MERAALGVIGAVELGIVLRAFEIGQHVRIGPALISERGPLIVVGLVAANIDHGVGGRGSAKTFAARLIADAAVETLLRYGAERPIVDLAGDLENQRAWRRHHPIIVRASGFKQRNG